jgi:hypothetical protein
MAGDLADADIPQNRQRRAWSKINVRACCARPAQDGLLPFRCKQFYATDLSARDRDIASFTVILQKSDAPSPTSAAAFCCRLASRSF